jgi:hypothetical protein
MNAQKQAEMIAMAARHPETDGFKCILPRIWGEHRPRRKNAAFGLTGEKAELTSPVPSKFR